LYHLFVEEKDEKREKKKTVGSTQNSIYFAFNSHIVSLYLLTPTWSLQKGKRQTENTNTEKKGKLETNNFLTYPGANSLLNKL